MTRSFSAIDSLPGGNDEAVARAWTSYTVSRVAIGRCVQHFLYPFADPKGQSQKADDPLTTRLALCKMCEHFGVAPRRYALEVCAEIRQPPNTHAHTQYVIRWAARA
jgi:hypothetical protein